MRSLGLPGLGFFDPCWPEKPETDWDDKPGLPRLVIPIRFGNFWSFLARKPGNGLGGQSLGFPSLSSESVSGFFGPFWPENPKMDWDDDKSGLPRLVIPVRFVVFWLFSA